MKCSVGQCLLGQLARRASGGAAALSGCRATFVHFPAAGRHIELNALLGLLSIARSGYGISQKKCGAPGYVDRRVSIYG